MKWSGSLLTNGNIMDWETNVCHVDDVSNVK